jgi:hypothetical protein
MGTTTNSIIWYNKIGGCIMQNQKELIKLMERWENTSPALYKANIKALCNGNDIKPRHIESALKVLNSTAKSYTNVNYKGRIEFLTALKLAELLKVNIEDFLKNI